MSIRSVHSARALRTHLSAEQFARGVRGGILTGATVTGVHDQVAGLLPGPHAIRVVTPRMCTRRVLTSMTNSTYTRLRKIVSTWKKSQASRPSAWARRNARQEVPTFRGAGLCRRARRIRGTVAALMR